VLPVILYGCETWSLTLRAEHRLRVCENRILRGMLGTKRDKVKGNWRKSHNEELHNLYSLPDSRIMKLRKLTLVEHVACMWKIINANKIMLINEIVLVIVTLSINFDRFAFFSTDCHNGTLKICLNQCFMADCIYAVHCYLNFVFLLDP
jgi:hypothetical protein